MNQDQSNKLKAQIKDLQGKHDQEITTLNETYERAMDQKVKTMASEHA